LKNGEVDTNILLGGSPGFGKTTLAQVLINTFSPLDNLQFDGGSVKMEQLEGQLVNELSRASSNGKRKIILIDEFDVMGADSKASQHLKSLMTKYRERAIFIATTNNIHLLSEPILSRFKGGTINLVPENADEIKEHKTKFYERAVKILNEENATFDEKTVKMIVHKNYPDFRSTISTLQLCKNMYNTIDSRALEITFGLNDKLIQAMKDKNIEEVIKQIKYVNIGNFFGDFYQNLFKLLESECVPSVINIIGTYNANKPFDKELNAVACINQLIFDPDVNLKWKKNGKK
jgi:replication-associated recombination protein RarA